MKTLFICMAVIGLIVLGIYLVTVIINEKLTTLEKLGLLGAIALLLFSVSNVIVWW